MASRFLLSFILIISIVSSEILNESIIKNLIIPTGNFTQFRISGLGIGDEALEDELARVTIEMTFNSSLDYTSTSIKQKKSFDLMVFSDYLDYICYVEAVNLL